MTATNDESRLDRVERILEALAVELKETADIARSNARSIQAWEARIEENRVEAEEERSELRVGLNDLRESVTALVRLSQRNEVEHELFRRRFEAIDPLNDEPQQ